MSFIIDPRIDLDTVPVLYRVATEGVTAEEIIGIDGSCVLCGVGRIKPFKDQFERRAVVGRLGMTTEEHAAFHQKDARGRLNPMGRKPPYGSPEHVSYGMGVATRGAKPEGEVIEVLHDEDGVVVLDENVSLKQLVKHAKKYGVGQVYETAAASDWPEELLFRLRIELDAIEGNRKSGRFTVGKRKGRTQAESIEAVRILDAEGKSVDEIAKALGIQKATARRYLKQAVDPVAAG